MQQASQVARPLTTRLHGHMLQHAAPERSKRAARLSGAAPSGTSAQREVVTLLTNSQALLRALVVLVVELGTTALVFAATYVALIRILRRAAAARGWSSAGEGHRPAA